jgi:hypothetical protein
MFELKFNKNKITPQELNEIEKVISRKREYRRG